MGNEIILWISRHVYSFEPRRETRVDETEREEGNDYEFWRLGQFTGIFLDLDLLDRVLV